MIRFLPFVFLLLVAGPAAAHEINASIFDCGCTAQCFTDEVTDVQCDREERQFSSLGLPDPTHTMMVGITGTNQQLPVPHTYMFRLPLAPEFIGAETPTVPGAIGVAVNGIPLFDPSTQGPIQAATGRPVSAFEAGELDECGGHAGRGDDYHYHMAPRCLIEEMGATAIEAERRPIGFAADGFPILALGWFEPGNDIEADLDTCRGIHDADEQYFYNVSTAAPYDILNCYNGSTERGFSRDTFQQRQNAAGQDIVGIPVGFTITAYERSDHAGGQCQHIEGVLGDEVVATSAGGDMRAEGIEGAIFYCDPGCYGQFLDRANARPRVIYFERQLASCPADYGPAMSNAFLEFGDR